MTDKKSSKSEFTEFQKRVGQAWSLHFKRQYDESIAEFRILVEEWPDDIDANYGLGLSLRWSGQAKEARDYFTKVAALVENAISAQAGADNSRPQMLRRMVEQQLESINKLL